MKKKKKINFWKILSAFIYIVVIIFSSVLILSSLKIGGYRVFVVKSGSMEPTIKTGSVVFDKKSNNYKIGDIITYKISNDKETLTHRIVEINNETKDIYYKTKGDANRAADSDKIFKSNVIGKTYFNIPYLGYLVAFLKTLPGLIIFIIIPATIIIYEEINKIKKEIQIIRKNKKKKKKNSNKIEKENNMTDKLIIIDKIKRWVKNNIGQTTKKKEEENEKRNI